MEGHLPIFMEMLNKEIALYSNYQYHDWAFDTIFFGGGTPSFLPSKDIEKILGDLDNTFNISNVNLLETALLFYLRPIFHSISYRRMPPQHEIDREE